jgi:hypothetical protein
LRGATEGRQREEKGREIPLKPSEKGESSTKRERPLRTNDIGEKREKESER